MRDKILKVVKLPWFVFVAGLLLGALIILAIRYFTYNPHSTHYHANFALYINGQREEFKSPMYYQEVAMCTTSGITMPEQRTHMHDEENSVVHVHDHVVTWGQFFENLGWYVGPNFIQTRDGKMYVADETNKLNLIINGQNYTDLTTITNTVIKDRDRLLVSFGNIDQATLQKEYQSVPDTAKKFDEAKDPASCSGSEKVTPAVRFKHLF